MRVTLVYPRILSGLMKLSFDQTENFKVFDFIDYLITYIKYITLNNVPHTRTIQL